MRYNFRGSKVTPADAYRLLDDAALIVRTLGVTTLDEAMAWDEGHGLTPEKGDWSCSEDITRKSRR